MKTKYVITLTSRFTGSIYVYKTAKYKFEGDCLIFNGMCFHSADFDIEILDIE